ncbi:MAG: polysaccharide biosynthesis tyrosine autokinase [Deltaproteobacteria bacterium]|nr:polysaccharide biosynthesis tyrosine autokinase [Deltaproteobacteria bacterium]
MTDPGSMHQPARSEFETEEGLSITEYLLIILDEWRILVLILVLTVLITGVYLLLIVPKYTATGVIQVSTSDNSGADALLELAGGGSSPVETEVEILRSRRIIGNAIRARSFNIHQKIPSLTTDLGVSLRGKSPIDPDLKKLREKIEKLTVADWVETPVQAVITATKDGGLRIRIGDSQERHTVASKGTFDKKGISFTVSEAQGPEPEKDLEVTILPGDIAAENVNKNLQVEGIGGGRKETNLVRVSFTGPDRVDSRDFVNALMSAYMSFALDWRTLRADRSSTFIEKQLDAIRGTLETSEKQLQSFVEQNGAVLLPEQAKELIRGGSMLELDKRKVKIQEDLLAMVIKDLSRSARRGEPSSLTGDFLFDDELLGKAIGALNELEMKRETLLSDVTEAHPGVIRLGKEIERVRSQVKEFVKASRGRIAERRRAISRELDTIQNDLASFPSKERQLAVLRRNLEVSQEMYRFLMTKLEESRILKASTTTDKRIIDSATTPFRHTKPRRMTTLILASFIGLLLGVGAVFARRAIDPRVRDEEEAKTLAGLPVYGAVPDLRGLGIVQSDDRILESLWKAPKGPAAESFRTIRTNVEFAQVGEESLKVLQVTSSEASEGKSTVISNLAVALAKAGHSVLVVDLDLRRPSQHRIWSSPRTPGISDHLVGQSKISLRRIEAYGIDFVSAGNEPPESQRLLASTGLSDLVDEWRGQYDYILLDTPPLLVADSLVISRMSDLMLFVVRPKHCRRAHLRLAQNTHERMELVKGLIINSVSTRRGGYYHYYRGSYYGSKTSDTQES